MPLCRQGLLHMSIPRRKPIQESGGLRFGRSRSRTMRMRRAIPTLAALLLAGGFALAQGPGGYPPGVNPSNPQDMTNRSNPQDMTLPGASNPQDLVRSPALPKALSPAPNPNLRTAPPLSLSLR